MSRPSIALNRAVSVGCAAMESVAKRGKRTRSKSIHLDDGNKDVNGDNQEQVDKVKSVAGADKPNPDGDEKEAPVAESETATTEPQNDEGKVNDTSMDTDSPASEEKTETSPVEEKKAEEKKPEVELPKLRGRKRAVTTSETSETKDQSKSSEPSKKGEKNEPDDKAASEPKPESDKPVPIEPEIPRLRGRKRLVVIEAAAIPMEASEEKDSTEKKAESGKKAEEKNKKSAESEKKSETETPKAIGRGRKRGASEMAVDNSTPEAPSAPAVEEAVKPETNGKCYLVYLPVSQQQTNSALNSLDLIGQHPASNLHARCVGLQFSKTSFFGRFWEILKNFGRHVYLSARSNVNVIVLLK